MKIYQTLHLPVNASADRAEADRHLRKLTGGDLDAAIDYRRHTSSCQAERCNQGRSACPCPTACELAEPDDMPWSLACLALPVTLVASVAIVVMIGSVVWGWLA